MLGDNGMGWIQLPDGRLLCRRCSEAADCPAGTTYQSRAGAEMTITAVAADGTGVRAFDEGDGPVILVIHPGLDDGRSWRKVAAQLSLVITRLDRLGSSVRNLIEEVAALGERGVDLIVVQQGIDTTTPAGKLLFHVMAAVAEFERDLISERARDGLAAARARGKKGGRKPSLSPDQVKLAREMCGRMEITMFRDLVILLVLVALLAPPDYSERAMRLLRCPPPKPQLPSGKGRKRRQTRTTKDRRPPASTLTRTPSPPSAGQGGSRSRGGSARPCGRVQPATCVA